MAQSDPESTIPIIVVRTNALREAASMTRSHIARLRMRHPTEKGVCGGSMIMLTDEAQRFRVFTRVEAIDQGIMIVNPLEIVSVGRSYRIEKPTPYGP